MGKSATLVVARAASGNVSNRKYSGGIPIVPEFAKTPAVYRILAIVGVPPTMLMLVWQIPVVPSEFTGSIPVIGAIQPALLGDPH